MEIQKSKRTLQGSTLRRQWFLWNSFYDIGIKFPTDFEIKNDFSFADGIVVKRLRFSWTLRFVFTRDYALFKSNSRNRVEWGIFVTFLMRFRPSCLYNIAIEHDACFRVVLLHGNCDKNTPTWFHYERKKLKFSLKTNRTFAFSTCTILLDARFWKNTLRLLWQLPV